MLQIFDKLRQGGMNSWTVLLLIITLVVLPKAGVVIEGVPISWGYMLLIWLGLSGMPAWLRGINARHLSWRSLLPLGYLLPFQMIMAGTFVLVGYQHLGYTLSLLFSFVAIPYLMASLASDILINQWTARLFKCAVRFVIIYGMLLFLASNTYGWMFEVPGLTTMLGGDVPLTGKNNNRYGFYKFVSTYSNGNIYGICLLMLLPLYAMLDSNRFVFLAKLSIILTTSRTAWIGLILYDLVMLGKGWSERNTQGVWQALRGLVIDVFAITVVAALIPWKSTGVFDKNLGGRLPQVNVLASLKEKLLDGEYSGLLLPVKPFERIYEMTYMGILESFGVLGLVFFVIAMGCPLYHIWVSARESKNPWLQAVCLSLLIYLVVAFSDGALINAPVMSFYWALVFFSLIAYESRKPDRLRSPPRFGRPR